MKVRPVVGQTYSSKESDPLDKWKVSKIEGNKCWAKHTNSKLESVLWYLLNDGTFELPSDWILEDVSPTHAVQVIWINGKNFSGELSKFVQSFSEQNLPITFITNDYYYPKYLFPKQSAVAKFVFSEEKYYEIITWLLSNNFNLSIMVHPLTGDWVKDRTSYAFWIGSKVPLDQESLSIPDPY